MSTLMQTLTDQLASAVAPNRTLKGVAKTLKHLARQLTKQQIKQAQDARKAAAPTAKKQRKVLAGELLTALRPHLGLVTAGTNETSKPIAKAMNRLAAQLLKQRRKQTKLVAEATRKAAKQHQKKQTIAPVLKVVRASAAPNGQLIAAPRRALIKRVASKATPAAAKKEAAAPLAA